MEQGDKFWAEYLTAAKMNGATPFPVLHNVVHSPNGPGDQTLSRTCIIARDRSTSLPSTTTVIMAAWALLAARYTNSSHVTVGRALEDGTYVPVVTHVTGESSAMQFLEDVQRNISETSTFALRNTTNIQGEYPHEVNTILAFIEQRDDLNTLSETIPGNFPLTLTCLLGNDECVHIIAKYDESFINTRQMERLLELLDHFIQELSSNLTIKVEDLGTCSANDYEEILGWNSAHHDPVEECIHWHFQKQAATQPDAEAVCGWDRNFTYRELDTMSIRLANHLTSQYGVGPEVIVPICFPKSAYTIVAMLAILRAGGAYTPIDPANPPSRTQEILRKTKATVVVSSPENKHLFDDAVGNVVLVSESHLAALSNEEQLSKQRVEVKPNNACNVMFTSGSTGIPKGIVLEHRQLCKVFYEHGRTSGFRKGFRALQFSAYTFDVCNSEIFETLFYGGVVCVPSDEDRLNDISGFIARNRVEWCSITPSLAGTLNPVEIPSMKVMGIGGEAVPKDVLVRWEKDVRLILTYG